MECLLGEFERGGVIVRMETDNFCFADFVVDVEFDLLIWIVKNAER